MFMGSFSISFEHFKHGSRIKQKYYAVTLVACAPADSFVSNLSYMT